jgi:hypothetical protein
MYPLGMSRSLAVAAALMALAAPAGAAAAPALKIVPEKACYSHGQSVNLLGTGFGPLGSASITRDGALVGALDTDSAGAFNGVLTLAQNSGRRTKTYTATDRTDSSLTASDQITVSSVRVGLKPHDGAPGRVMTITARGFTTGKTLWAHVIHKKSKRNLKIGRLKGACGGLKTRRRLLPQNAALGVHRIQFDTFRTYNRRRPVQDSSTIAVRRG